jgi:hypothetical protein
MNDVIHRNNSDRLEKEIRAKKNREKSGALYILNDELKAFLNLKRLPGRLNVPQTAGFLGFKPHDIAILVKENLLQPLGEPVPNSEKYFATTKILRYAEDEEWLSLATAALNQYWGKKNARKTKAKGVTIRLNSPTAR